MSLKGSLKKAAGSVMGGTLGWAFDKTAGKWMKKSRAEQNADTSREAEYQQKMAALGLNELGQYKDIVSGKTSGITPEQQAGIDRKVSVEQAQMRQGLASSGIADSTARLAGESAVQQDKIAMQEATTQATMKEHWDAFIKATGIAEGSSQILYQMAESDRKEAMQIYSSAMGAMGQVAGSYKSAVSEYAGSGASSWNPGRGSVNGDGLFGEADY